MKKTLLLAVVLATICAPPIFAQETVEPGETPHQHEMAATFKRENALAISQSAVGNSVADFKFVSTREEKKQLSDYAGKPLIISLIYTSCYHICPTTTQHLNKVVNKAKKVLGDDSFNVITIGFDTANDTAKTMGAFAKQQSVNEENWDFLATDKNTVFQLSQDLGFQFIRSPSGFDHLIQTTLLDSKGVVVRQVYGMTFETPHLVGPLKQLVFSENIDHSLFQEISAKIRLFCTVYDPYSDSYQFDYSIFVGLFVGLFVGGLMVFFVLREWRHSNSSRAQLKTNQSSSVAENEPAVTGYPKMSVKQPAPTLEVVE